MCEMFSKKFEKPAFHSNSTEKLILNFIKIPLKTYTKEHTFDMIAEWPATLVQTGSIMNVFHGVF